MNRHVQLPGMPLAPSDVHVCTGIGDGQPPVRLHVLPAQRPPLDTVSRSWLVLTLCPSCNVVTGRYCSDHNVTNWWLTRWGRP